MVTPSIETAMTALLLLDWQNCRRAATLSSIDALRHFRPLQGQIGHLCRLHEKPAQSQSWPFRERSYWTWQAPWTSSPKPTRNLEPRQHPIGCKSSPPDPVPSAAPPAPG